MKEQTAVPPSSFFHPRRSSRRAVILWPPARGLVAHLRTAIGAVMLGPATRGVVLALGRAALRGAGWVRGDSRGAIGTFVDDFPGGRGIAGLGHGSLVRNGDPSPHVGGRTLRSWRNSTVHTAGVITCRA